MATWNSKDVLQIGEWTVNPALDTISRGSETQKLEPRTMQLLMCLANSAGSVVSVDRLLTDVWTGVVVGSASVYQSVSQLRKLLGDVDPEPSYIATVPRKGYRLIAPVRRIEPAPARETPAEIVLALPAPSSRRRLASLGTGAAVIVVLVLSTMLAWKKIFPSHQAAATIASIVVLPFIDMTADKTEQSFCDGLTEELSNWLAQIPTLRVVARTSAFAFRGQNEDVRKIGEALNTNHILEGSMRRSGDHMRVTVQLIDARNGYHLWSEDFDTPVEDAIKIQEDISRSVAGTLKLRLTPESELQFAQLRSSDTEAYQLYLLGRHYQQQLTADSTDRAIDLYRQVLNADPKFAPAYVQLAYANINQGYFHDLPVADVTARVEPLIASALRLDEKLSGAYAVRGFLRAKQSKTSEALADLNHAVALNPNDMGAWAELGQIQLFDGQPRGALQNYERAASLDPLNSLLQVRRCTAFEDLAQFEDAASACERARVLQPGSKLALSALALLAESRGRIDEALRWNDEALKADATSDFDLYWKSAALLLSLGMPGPARTAVNMGRASTKDDAGADAALVRVEYCDGGEPALRKYLGSRNLEGSTDFAVLNEAAYGRMVLRDATAAKELTSRALAAANRPPAFADAPWYARGGRSMGISYRLDLAVADLTLGDRLGAQRELDSVLGMVNKMITAGVERNATYELRAKVYALQGKGDEAMRDLDKAAKLGWRRAWWAEHEPYFETLRPRKDFQSLIAQTNRSNTELIGKLTTEQPIYFRRFLGLLTRDSRIANTTAASSKISLFQ
jgi:TolB-like protein/DNA-binding winged helix-turn-helix (wHTH) protein/Flp pilus assembly protein TadD